jgi:lipopolysaccharide transport system ATP-binding protein
MKPIIRIDNISKLYNIGGLDAGYVTFRETLAGAIARPFRRIRGEQGRRGDSIWALKDVSFQVMQGEVVGVIGNNGAGKSTLLKILSRITQPTTGRTEVYGRLGSLLEVGTGFHPDLTGRENVFMNGSILGIRRAEIARKFDEIVEFSGIEKFIDTPVKWYSSGMYLRLAFSVAVHLDTEVLVMDEVLAVGDVAFQLKCMDKMNEIRNQGRTILFVSHNMAAMTRLCSRVVLLERGLLTADGPAHEVVSDYLGSSWKVTSEREWLSVEEAPSSDAVRLLRVRVRNKRGETAESVGIQEAVGVQLTYDVLQPDQVLVPKIDLLNEEGLHLFSSHDVGPEWRRQPRPVGRYVSTIWIPGNFLSGGNLLANVSIMSHYPSTVIHIEVAKAVAFQVLEAEEGQSARGDYAGPIAGMLRPLLGWDTEFYSQYEEIPPPKEEVGAFY